MARPRQRIIDLGGFRAIKLGTPSAFGDLYYHTMEMSWPAFIVWVSLAFAVITLAFGALYAALPGRSAGCRAAR